MYHLILNAFPSWVKYNSVFAMQPFYTPEKNAEIFKGLGILDQFDIGNPAFIPPPFPITAHQTTRQVLEDQKRFKVPWAESGYLKTFMLSGDGPENAKQRKLVGEKFRTVGCPNGGDGSMQQYREYANEISLTALEAGGIPLGRAPVGVGRLQTYQIDIVKE